MPVRPGRPCAKNGCPALVPAGYCPEHERARQDTTRQKDPHQVKFYGSARWKKLRAVVRAQEPVCRMCQGRPSQTVDHINHVWTDNRRENLQGLCWECHAQKSGREHGGSRR